MCANVKMCTCEYSQEGRLSRPLTKAPNYLVSDCFPRHSGSFTILQHSADPRRFYKPVLPLPIVPLTCSPDLNCRTYTTTCMHCFPGRVGLKMYSVVSWSDSKWPPSPLSSSAELSLSKCPTQPTWPEDPLCVCLGCIGINSVQEL